MVPLHFRSPPSRFCPVHQIHRPCQACQDAEACLRTGEEAAAEEVPGRTAGEDEAGESLAPTCSPEWVGWTLVGWEEGAGLARRTRADSPDRIGRRGPRVGAQESSPVHPTSTVSSARCSIALPSFSAAHLALLAPVRQVRHRHPPRAADAPPRLDLHVVTRDNLHYGRPAWIIEGKNDLERAVVLCPPERDRNDSGDAREELHSSIVVSCIGDPLASGRM